MKPQKKATHFSLLKILADTIETIKGEAFLLQNMDNKFKECEEYFLCHQEWMERLEPKLYSIMLKKEKKKKKKVE